MTNILVVRLSAIGDCTLVLPVVRVLLAHLPDANIHWLIDKNAYALLSACQHPRLHFHVIDKPRTLSDLLSIRRMLMKALGEHTHFDAVLAMQANTRVNLLYPFIPTKRIIGFDRTRARELQWCVTRERVDFAPEHLHDGFMRFAHKLGLPSSLRAQRDDFMLTLSDQAQQEYQALNLPKRFAVINPAASKRERSWPAKRYAQIAAYLWQQHQLPVVLTGGPAPLDRELCAEIEREHKAHSQIHHEAPHEIRVYNVVGKTSLQGLACVLQHATLCIAPDTGPAHIANGVGTPVVGLYAVISSRLSGPYHSLDTCVDAYDTAVRTLLKKDPSTIKWNTRVHDANAMHCVEVEHVVAAIERVLGDKRLDEK